MHFKKKKTENSQVICSGGHVGSGDHKKGKRTAPGKSSSEGKGEVRPGFEAR